jgi:hypothetical protein
MIKAASCFLAVSLLAACQSTSATANRQTVPRQNLQQRAVAQSAVAAEPPPPAEGPGPANSGADPGRNPSLVPSPLLRDSAAAHL